MRRNGASAPSDESSPSTGAHGHRLERTTGLSGLRRTVLIVESDGHCRALVRLGDGRRSVSGRAVEPRWRREWTRRDGAMVLEPVHRPRRAALAICTLRAYGQALALWREGDRLHGMEQRKRIRQRGKAC